MKVSHRQLAEIIGKLTHDTHDVKTLATEIAAYLISEKKVASLNSIVRDIMQYRADNGVVEATAVSAHQLENSVISDIQEILKANFPATKMISVNEQIDSSVVGGVRIDFANEMLDMTTKSKMNKFKRLTGAVNG